MIKRIQGCPKCKNSQLALEDDGTLRVICLICDWKIPAKREEDKNIDTMQKIRDKWYGANGG